MNANHDLERRIADFYASEAPGRAPDWVLGAALSTIDNTSQRRVPFLPRRFQDMNSYAKLAVAAVVVIAAGAVGLAILPRDDSRGVGTDPSPSPTVSVAPSPSTTPAPTDVAGSAATFIHPFAYVLPAGVGWDDPAPYRRYSLEFRISDSGGAGVSAVGVIVRAFTGGRADPCAPSSADLPIPAGPDAVIEYLKTIPTVEVSGETPVTVDGRPAVQASVTLGSATADCPDVRPFTADGLSEQTEVISALRGVPVRVTAFDVDGEHLVLWTFLTGEDQSWYEVADELIASFRFE